MQHFVPLPSNVSHNTVENSEQLAMVTTDSVYKKLLKFNPKKAMAQMVSPRGYYADLLAGPVTDIINCSYQESWPGRKLTWWPFQSRNQLKI